MAANGRGARVGRRPARRCGAPGTTEPRRGGVPGCAEEDSNLHGPFSPLGPQPSASTNSAIGADGAPPRRGDGEDSSGFVPGERCPRRLRRGVAFRPGAALRCRTHVRFRARVRGAMDLTKRQQEIFDFIKSYSAKYGYPPTVRDIGKRRRSDLVLDGARAPREPREARAAAARSVEAAGARVARPGDARRRRGGAGRDRPRRRLTGAAARRRGRRRPADPGRGEHRGVRPGARGRRRRRTASTSCACAATR